jgi:hypothetical protein
MYTFSNRNHATESSRLFSPDPSTDYGSYFSTLGETELRNWNSGGMTMRSFEPSLADDTMPLVRRIAPTPLRMILTDGDTLCLIQEQLKAYASEGQHESLLVVPGHHYSVYTTAKDMMITCSREWFVKHLTSKGHPILGMHDGPSGV